MYPIYDQLILLLFTLGPIFSQSHTHIFISVNEDFDKHDWHICLVCTKLLHEHWWPVLLDTLKPWSSSASHSPWQQTHSCLSSTSNVLLTRPVPHPVTSSSTSSHAKLLTHVPDPVCLEQYHCHSSCPYKVDINIWWCNNIPILDNTSPVTVFFVIMTFALVIHWG